MFKPTRLVLGAQRTRMTSKRGNKNYYKGTGSGAMGQHTKRGGYQLDYNKVRTYVVPEGLETTELKPYVAETRDPVTTRFGVSIGGFKGYADVLDRIIQDNIEFGIESDRKG